MKRAFSKRVQRKATLETEPHFVFLVIDPNQQELLFEDVDFRETYANVLADLRWRCVPFAILCTHGDVISPLAKSRLADLPSLLRLKQPNALVDRPTGPEETSGLAYLPSDSFAESVAAERADSFGALAPRTAAFERIASFSSNRAGSFTSNRDMPGVDGFSLPEQIRLVANYTKPLQQSLAASKSLAESRSSSSSSLNSARTDLENGEFVSVGSSRPLPLPKTAISAFPSAPAPPVLPVLESSSSSGLLPGTSGLGCRKEQAGSSSATHKDGEQLSGSSGTVSSAGPAAASSASGTSSAASSSTESTRASSKNSSSTKDDAENVQQDIHILLVLIDALNNADHYIAERLNGTYGRKARTSEEGECVIL